MTVRHVIPFYVALTYFAGEAAILASNFGTIFESSDKPKRDQATLKDSTDNLITKFMNFYLEDEHSHFNLKTRNFGSLVIGYVMEGFRDYLNSIDDSSLESSTVSSTTAFKEKKGKNQ